MRKIALLPFLFLLFSDCNHKTAASIGKTGAKLDFEKTLTTVSFGSCNDQNRSQDIWQFIGANNPDLWIWLGDNVYADTEDMAVMEAKYTKQKTSPEYAEFIKNCPVLGTWDDHDFGKNDAGKEYPMKASSKQLMLDFLDVDKNAAVRTEGVAAHQVYTFGRKGQQVKIILLDARYFRDRLVKDENPDKRYKANEEGDILGEAQWAWLEKELKASEAQVHIIGSGIQFIPEEHGWEKWANFPKARKRLFDLLAKTKPAHPFLISGDRHIAELSKFQIPGLAYPIYELTSSGLTHTWSSPSFEKNQHRVGDMVIKRNFGLLHINWEGADPFLTVEVKGLNNASFLKKQLQY